MFIFVFENESDRARFEYIYNKYKNLLFVKANEICKNRTLAEDAVSEAFFRIYKNMSKLVDDDSPSSVSFMVTVVKNTALTIIKKENANQTYSLTNENDDGETDIADIYDLEDEVFDRLDSDMVYNLVNQLRDRRKSVFLLKYARDLPHKEISRILGISENDVTVTLHRAKKQLAELLKREGYVHG